MMLPEPCARMIGAACFMPHSTPFTSTAISPSTWAGSRVSTPPRAPGMPALLKTQSRRPKRAFAPSMSAATWRSSATSAATNDARSPSESASASPSAARRPDTTTVAPSATKTSAVLRPMPLVAPAITATLPSRRPTAQASALGRAATVACQRAAFGQSSGIASSARVPNQTAM